MKHSEFKRRVEELGFEVIDRGERLLIANENGEFAWVSKDHESVMGNNTSIKLSKEVRTKLFNILVEYARTPIEDRKDEKKYSIYPIWTKDQRIVRYNNTFRNYGYENERSFGIDDSEFYYKDISTTFSESEAIEICDFFGWDFDKVAVEVDS